MKYQLKNDEITVAFDTLGGQLTSIRDNTGTEYLWQGDKAYWGGQAPVLFPIVGSLRNKKAVIGGDKICNMERHGVVRRMEFDPEEITGDSITFSVCSNEETRARYPYDFQLKIKYTVSGRDITTKYIVINQSGTVLPFQIGGHPAFNCPLGGEERFEDYTVEFEQEETADCPTSVPETGLVDVDRRTRILDHSRAIQLKHDLFRVDALIFDRLRSKKAKLFHPGTGRGVQITFADFENLLVWSSANGGPFVALEPWNGLSTCSDENDVFEQKRGVCLLPEGQQTTFSFMIRILG